MMTPQEAIEKLRYQEKMRSKGICYQVNNLVVGIAIEALEKQIPKKLVLKEYGNGFKENRCPTCNEQLYGFDLDENCSHCGQKIDWSE